MVVKDAYTMETAAQLTAGCVSHWYRFSAEMIAMIMWQRNIPTPPTIMTGFRPSLPTYRIAGMVTVNMATPTTLVVSKLVVFLDIPRAAKIEGAWYKTAGSLVADTGICVARGTNLH
jgi:hypothetical protein